MSHPESFVGIDVAKSWLELAGIEPCLPVAGPAAKRGNSDDSDFTLVVEIDEGELELPVHDTSGLVLVLWPELRSFDGSCLRGEDSLIKALAEPGAQAGVVLDLMQELGASLRVIAN